MKPTSRVGLARLTVVLTVLAGFLPAGAAAAATSAYDPLSPVGQLVPAGTGEGLAPVALADGDAFAGAPDAALSARAQGAVFVYAPSAAGWSGTTEPIATLTATQPSPGDGLGVSVQSDGKTVVAGSQAGSLYVFTQPSGGWAGSLHEAAVLTASNGEKLSNPVLSGSTIVARAEDATAQTSSVYVFSEPASGWAGRLHESAVLTASDATSQSQLGSAIAVSGSTVVAGDPLAKVGSHDLGAVYVFAEPAGGWSGTQHETAKLTGSDVSTGFSAPYFGADVALSGNTILAALPGMNGPGAEYVFTQPAGGWRSATESAKLIARGGNLTAGAVPLSGPTFSMDAGTIAVSGWADTGPTANRPAVFVYQQPAGGWSGTLDQSATLVSSDRGSLLFPTVSGNTVFAGALRAAAGQAVIGDGPAYVFTQPAGGWSGTLSETARLSSAASGSTGGVALFAEPTAGWSSEGPTATLVPPGDHSTVTFDDVAASGQTVVGSGSGDAFVYTTPSSGWPSIAPGQAQLIDSGGQQLGAVGVSGATAVALAKGTPYSGDRVDVFEQPSAGWVGSLKEAATLTPSDGAPLYSVAVDGSTVVALGGTWQHATAYVFSAPAGGWTGTLHEVAKLQVPGYAYQATVSVQGATVVVDGSLSGVTVVSSGTAYVFSQPPGGWSGSLTPTATLAPPSWQQGEAHIYLEPSSGWVGSVRPAARLLGAGPGMAISGSTVALSEVAYPTSRYEFCPCSASVLLFTKPPGGWSGTLSARPALTAETDEAGALPVALEGNVLFAGGQPVPNFYGEAGLGVFQITGPILESPFTPGSPTGHLRVSGLARGRPRLTLGLQAGLYGPPIQSFSLALPSGLRFSRHFLRGLGHLGTAIRVHLRRGRLVVTFVGYQAQSFTLPVGSRSLIESSRLRGRARHRGRGRLHFVVRVTDASGALTRLAISVPIG
jgi:hypothetical protein